jgi:sugar lactone lactonase YvrE
MIPVRPCAAAVLAAALLAGCGEKRAADAPPAGDAVPAAEAAPALRMLATLGTDSSVIEGLAEHGGLLYTADWKDGAVYRIDPAKGVTRVGALPTKPGTAILGLAADAAGNVYAAVPETGTVYRIDAARLGAPDFDAARDATPFATGAAGANGINFDADGHLWISGGAQNAVYHVGPSGGAAQVFAKGYAHQATDTTMPVRAYVTNGLGIDSKGAIYTANTGTGEIVRIERKPGNAAGAITTVTSDRRLLGADGIVVTPGDTLYVTANFSNTIAKIDPTGAVTILATDDAAETLRFPAELKKVGDKVYVANLNFPLGRNARQAIKGASVAVLQLP